jgi:glyceraldehyde-3-phosphate dehydrogenase (NAD(P))
MGLGIIGKRMADAVNRQPDLALAGAAVRGPNGFVLARPDVACFATSADATTRLRAAGIAVHGLLHDLLAAADVVIDCGPARTGATRAATYRAAGVRALYCGGERDAGLWPLVHPALNPAAATGNPGVRLVSCNTTALARVAAAIGVPDIAELDATVVRCATDTDKAAKGITNGAVLAARASHHAADLAAIAPGLTARSVALTVPMTAGHVIRLRVALRAGASAMDALGRMRATTRISLLPGTDPIATADVRASMPRRWHDRYELLVQRIDEQVPGRLDLWLALDNQAITIPEGLDVLRLAGGADPDTVGTRTDQLLGLDHAAEAMLSMTGSGR